MTTADTATAQAFANSWNNLPPGSVYTPSQFIDWMQPLQKSDFEGKDVLELGCGNGSLLVHSCHWQPRRIVGVDLGASVQTARRNVADFPSPRSYRRIWWNSHRRALIWSIASVCCIT